MSSPRLCLLTAILAIILTASSQVLAKPHRHAGQISTSYPEFDYLVLAQFWPPTSCYIYQSNGTCKGIPKAVTGFTLHGLWPTIPDKIEPIYCDNSSRFDYSLIESLGPRLEVQWSDYNVKYPEALWSHEWMKHGTCSGALPELRGEYNYFRTTLDLHKPLDVFGALKSRGVVPSDSKFYTAEDFFNAIVQGLGKKPRILCTYSRETHEIYLDQIYLCYTKALVLEDCADEFFIECPKTGEKVIFLPFRDRAPAATSGQKALLFESEWEEEVITVDVE